MSIQGVTAFKVVKRIESIQEGELFFIKNKEIDDIYDTFNLKQVKEINSRFS